MNPSFYFQFALHGICEWAAAFAIAFWVSQVWSENPAPALVQWARGPHRQWLMVAFGIAPYVLSLLLQPLLIKLYTNGAAAGARIPISYFLSILYGTLVGLASSFCTAPATDQQEFRPGPPATISAVLIACSFLLSTLLRFQHALHVLGGIVLALVILFVARSIIAGEAPQPAPHAEPAPPPVQRALWPALLIGFMPAALILAAIAVGSSTNLSNDTTKALLVVCSVVSVVCCFTASVMLFRRHTGGAIAGGVLLMLLNAFIAFFFGCCAALTGASFH
jgi:hypothetical protein